MVIPIVLSPSQTCLLTCFLERERETVVTHTHPRDAHGNVSHRWTPLSGVLWEEKRGKPQTPPFLKPPDPNVWSSYAVPTAAMSLLNGSHA